MNVLSQVPRMHYWRNVFLGEQVNWPVLRGYHNEPVMLFMTSAEGLAFRSLVGQSLKTPVDFLWRPSYPAPSNHFLSSRVCLAPL